MVGTSKIISKSRRKEKHHFYKWILAVMSAIIMNKPESLNNMESSGIKGRVGHMDIPRMGKLKKFFGYT